MIEGDLGDQMFWTDGCAECLRVYLRRYVDAFETFHSIEVREWFLCDIPGTIETYKYLLV